MKPIYAELEAFEGKVAQMKEHIRDQMQALVAEPSQRTSVAAFCRLSEVEREHHRKSAAFRLQEVANNWNLSRITEASIVSRSRISTVSLTGFTGRTLANLPATQEDVFDEESESETSAANKSFISLIPQKTSQRKGRQSSKVPDPISGATGDHPVISDAQDTEPQNVHESEDTVLVHHETADELTGFKHAEEMAKPEQGKRKAATRPAVVRKPRTKKVVVATAAVSDDAMGEANLAENLATPSEDLVASCPPAADVNATNNLRPRRKGANYKVGEDTSTPKKKKLVKRRKKAIPSE